MPKNENTAGRPHNLSVENRKLLKATGVADVEGFDETKIVGMLDDMAFTIGGKSLKIISFSAESGNLQVEGEIDSVVYSNSLSRRAGFFARVFR